jgi:hypothetical protein
MMSVAFILGWILAVALVAVGLVAVAAPHELARRYGVAVHGPDGAAFVRATGVRDIAIGMVLGATAYLHSLPLLIVLAIVGIVVSIADLRIVTHHGQTHRYHAAHAVHASGVVAFVLVLAMALFAIGR